MTDLGPSSPLAPVPQHLHGPALLLAGPTATGKSAVALELASLLHAEIVSFDSMQVYRGMDVGTAKPSPAERALIPHHLLDVADPREPFSAARFLELAHQAVAAIHARGLPAILCGGTGLYFKAWIEGLGNAPAPRPDLRATLESTPLPDLLRELQSVDPTLAASIDPHNRRRLVRAVEIARLTGQPPSSFRTPWNPSTPSPATPILCLDRTPPDLHQRIDARVNAMFAQDLVGETRRLLDLPLPPNATALQAIGYRQVAAHLRGELPLAPTIDLVKQKTRQFVKRQRTFFRHQLPTHWLHVPPTESPTITAHRILSLLPFTPS